MTPAAIFSSSPVMDTLAQLHDPAIVVWITAVASAAVFIPLLLLWFRPNLSKLRSWLQFATNPSTTSKAKAPSTESSNDSDSGYAGSEPETNSEDGDSPDTAETPQCGGILDEEDESDENCDLHRAIRLCQQSATPKRAPPSPYSRDFEVFSSFLTATEEKAKRYRDAR
ncbi:hypothetical protein M409DRAFT_59006 [Zasmidium cellare ATCC 36951]|uniref:Uncharacterized protein n=1 Tax=Zasmidium cellare ATCC 36951 TaxID=1080233 RepID=A0A6A6C3K9_ZASCE|nr:uncharacterized protein M409DRAFT_59006 [Zasmidium cellare ATCC 36951]KAF2161621.1 hypothetical protein M409DRAFT_59006 [Zasmidium cellare ATCC 36951]